MSQKCGPQGGLEYQLMLLFAVHSLIFSLSSCSTNTFNSAILPTKLVLLSDMTFSNNPQRLYVIIMLLICMVHLSLSCYHVIHVFQTESTLYSYVNLRNSLLETDVISKFK